MVYVDFSSNPNAFLLIWLLGVDHACSSNFSMDCTLWSYGHGVWMRWQQIKVRTQQELIVLQDL